MSKKSISNKETTEILSAPDAYKLIKRGEEEVGKSKGVLLEDFKILGGSYSS